jgi:hypothetical protein
MNNAILTGRAESLTNALFSLEEPWRSRFLYLIAHRATGEAAPDQPPTREDVTAWLNSGSLRQVVALLLQAWQ